MYSLPVLVTQLQEAIVIINIIIIIIIITLRGKPKRF